MIVAALLAYVLLAANPTKTPLVWPLAAAQAADKNCDDFPTGAKGFSISVGLPVGISFSVDWSLPSHGGRPGRP